MCSTGGQHEQFVAAEHQHGRLQPGPPAQLQPVPQPRVHGKRGGVHPFARPPLRLPSPVPVHQAVHTRQVSCHGNTWPELFVFCAKKASVLTAPLSSERVSLFGNKRRTFAETTAGASFLCFKCWQIQECDKTITDGVTNKKFDYVRVMNCDRCCMAA